MGRFYGYKFHRIGGPTDNQPFRGDSKRYFSKGNAADNNKKLLREITENFIGLLIGDKGDRRSDISLLSEKSY